MRTIPLTDIETRIEEDLWTGKNSCVTWAVWRLPRLMKTDRTTLLVRMRLERKLTAAIIDKRHGEEFSGFFRI